MKILRRSCGGFGLALLALAPAAAQTPLLVLSGAGQPNSFGWSADALGDWDGDGYGDVAVSIPAPVAGGLPPGSVQVRSGLNGAVLATFSGTLEKQQFGEFVAGLGDADADGAVDIAIAAAPQFGTSPASLQVFSSATGDLIFAQQLPKYALGPIAGVGDVNADGFADVAERTLCSVGGSIDPGKVQVLGGPDGALLHSWCGDGLGDQFGGVIAAGGDLNHDGYADVLAGAGEGDNFTPEGNGYVRAFSGFDGATLFTWEGQPIYNNGFGTAVSSAGDVDGDGTPDVLVGARQEKVNDLFYGSASVYSGSDGSLLHHVLGTLVYKQFGFNVAGPGDVDGDGLADFAVATDQIDVPGPPHYGYVVYSGADASPLHAVPLGPSVTALDIGLRAAGDLNADGVPDLLVISGQPSAPYFDTVRVLSGAPVLFADLGSALPGSAGTPHLQIEGVLHKGLPLTLTISDAPPLAPLFLVLGNAAAPTPFKGGVLVPLPQSLVTLATDASGGLTIATMSPALPAGFTIVVQGWLPDAPAPTHFAATNAVQGEAP